MDHQELVVELLAEQNELLKKHLARLKFSLMTLMLLTTAICCALGFIIWSQQNSAMRIVPAARISYPPVYVAPAMPTPPDIPKPKFRELPTVPLNNPATG